GGRHTSFSRDWSSDVCSSDLIDDVVSLAFQVKMFLDELLALIEPDRPVIAHFHEWMAGLPILDIRREKMRIKTIFTTHATQLGRSEERRVGKECRDGGAAEQW